MSKLPLSERTIRKEEVDAKERPEKRKKTERGEAQNGALSEKNEVKKEYVSDNDLIF